MGAALALEDKLIPGKDLTASQIQKIQDRFRVDHIAPINFSYPESMQRLLTIDLTEVYNERRAIAKILSGESQKSFETGVTLHETEYKGDLFRYALETPSIDHLFDNVELRTCSLHERGQEKAQAALLINDPYTALVHLRNVTRENRKVALSYNFLAYGYQILVPFVDSLWLRFAAANSKSDMLLVDDVNGYMKNAPKSWRHDFRLAHERLARHTNSQTIVYGSNHGNNKETATEMHEYIAHKVADASNFASFVEKKGSIPFFGLFTSKIRLSGMHPLLPNQTGDCGIYQGYSYATPKK